MINYAKDPINTKGKDKITHPKLLEGLTNIKKVDLLFNI